MVHKIHLRKKIVHKKIRKKNSAQKKNLRKKMVHKIHQRKKVHKKNPRKK